MNNLLRRYTLPILTIVSIVVAGCKDLPVDIPKVDVPDFSLDCPGVTEHAAFVDTFLVIAHRGVPTKVAENTIPSFRLALEEGANALEIDLCMTSDGRIVLWHDWNPNDAISLTREQGGESGMKVRPRFPPIGNSLRRHVDELTLDEFRANYWYATKNLIDKDRVDAEIPTLEQFLEWAAPQDGLYYVMLDIKLPESRSGLADLMISRIDSMIKAYQPKFKSVYMSPHPTVWQGIGRLIQDAALAFDVDLGGGLLTGEPCDISSSRYARQRGSGFATTMHPFIWTESPWRTLKSLLFCDLQARDTPVESGQAQVVEKVVAATIDDGAKMECLVDMGVDGLITNDPALLRSIAANRGRRL
jgi:glycerophosphoryl diester phosphodiesterase